MTLKISVPTCDPREAFLLNNTSGKVESNYFMYWEDDE